MVVQEAASSILRTLLILSFCTVCSRIGLSRVGAPFAGIVSESFATEGGIRNWKGKRVMGVKKK